MTDLAVDVPEGLTTRPLRPDDARAVFDVMVAQEQHDLGRVEIEEADIVADWQRPGFDVSASAIGVFDGDRLIGYGEHSRHDYSDAAVHPDYRGRGIGTALAGWIRDTARARGAAKVGMPVPEGSAGDRLAAELGYYVRWTSWILQLPEGAEIRPQPLPEGYVVREARPDEYEQVWTVNEDAFLEWSERERDSFEEWASGVIQRPGFEPWNLRVVTDPTGDVVGMSHLVLAEHFAYVARLAVRKDQRHRGLARALLVDSFAVGREHGASVSELSTDSRTGALALYEKVGMVVTSVWLHRAIDL